MNWGKRCADLEAHGPHEWIGFPPDVWECPGRAWLTPEDIELLAEAFGGSRPSELLLTRVERIVARHVGRVLPPGASS